jgi:hypothetical protein
MLLTNQLDAERLLASGSQCPMASTIAWLKGVIAKPHPQLGRSGSVCPFVPRAMQLSVLWFAQVSFAELAGELAWLRDQFFVIEPTDADRKIGKTVLFIVPDMPDSYIVDGTWLNWLSFYLEVGLKITAFHPKHAQIGMHNPAFLSHVSPYPLLTVRHLHRRDIAFVDQLVGTKEGELLEKGYARLFQS